MQLIVEITGQYADDADLKAKAAERWVAAVNNHGVYGRWQYVVIEDPQKLGLAIDQYAVAYLDDVQIELTGK